MINDWGKSKSGYLVSDYSFGCTKTFLFISPVIYKFSLGLFTFTDLFADIVPHIGLGAIMIPPSLENTHPQSTKNNLFRYFGSLPRFSKPLNLMQLKCLGCPPSLSGIKVCRLLQKIHQFFLISTFSYWCVQAISLFQTQAIHMHNMVLEPL